MPHLPKYQVFISSTYEDLKSERDQVVKAVLEMGHIPVGMEMFSAADDEQWNIIKRNIEASDYYVVIVAHRYGSMVEGVSYTEKEYDYALDSKVPVLGFVINDAAAWPDDRRDKGANAEEQARKLKLFKDKVRRKPVDFWKTTDDLHAKVAIALMKTMTAQPRIGWIPASQAASPEAGIELARLSKENSELRAALEVARKSGEALERFREIEEALRSQTIAIAYRGRGTITKHQIPTTLLAIFDALGQFLASGEDDTSLALRLAENLIAAVDPKPDWTQLHEPMREWLREFIVQDLVVYESKHVPREPFPDHVERWTLTDTGRGFLRYRRRRNQDVTEQHPAPHD